MSERSRDDVIRIVQKLLRKTVENGCSPAEAAFATGRVKHLLEKFQLSMVDVKSKVLNEDMIRRRVDSGRKVRNPGEACLAMAVAEGCEVRVVCDHSCNYGFNFLGFKSDVEVVAYLFETLRDGLLKRADAEGRLEGKQKAQLVRWRNSFLMGAAGEIRRRLQEERQERQRIFEDEAAQVVAENNESPTSTVSPMALVEIKQPQVESFVKTTYPRTKTSPINVKRNYSAFERGQRAGREVALRPGVNHTERQTIP